MKKLVLIFLMIVYPITAFASEIANEARNPQLSIEWYADELKQFRPSLKKDIDESNDSYYIINALQAQLNANWKQSYEPRDQEQADYRVIFISIEPTYQEKTWFDWNIKLPDLDPPLPKNKHASEVGVTPYNFVSPWMRGVLYIKDGKHIGGVIFLPISPFARINELYHATHKEWGEVTSRDSTVLDEMSIQQGTALSTLKLYEKIFTYTEMPIEKRLEKAEEIFAYKGKTVLTLARLAAISGSFDGQLQTGSTEYKCLKNSDIFYNRLYKYLFTKLFTETTFTTDDRTINNIAPSNKILQSLHDASGNYNCFSPDFKEPTQ